MYSGNLFLDTFANLIWMSYNTLLAVIPFVLAKKLFTKRKNISFSWIIGFIIYVLFLPNAPYIFTDIIHLPKALSALDTPMELAIMTGQYFLFILIGYWLFATSYNSFEKFAVKQFKINKNALRCVSFCAISTGIYLGRFLRFNSWDVIFNPTGLTKGIILSLTSPKAMVFIVLFAVFLFGAYLLIEKVKYEKSLNR